MKQTRGETLSQGSFQSQFRWSPWCWNFKLRSRRHTSVDSAFDNCLPWHCWRAASTGLDSPFLSWGVYTSYLHCHDSPVRRWLDRLLDHKCLKLRALLIWGKPTLDINILCIFDLQDFMPYLNPWWYRTTRETSLAYLSASDNLSKTYPGQWTKGSKRPTASSSLTMAIAKSWEIGSPISFDMTTK